jgi:glycosyltransferase involved in cell wall biosynthesis
MKILYIHQYFCTPKGSSGVRSYEFAKRWVEAGHSVRIVTSMGYDDSLKPGAVEDIDGITVQTIGGSYSPEMGMLARIWAFFVFAFQSTWIAARSRDYDVVLATSTPITVAVPAAAARWIARRPVVFEVRDVWPDAAIDAGVLTNPALIFVARMLEKLAYGSANHLVPLSTGMEQRMERKGVDPARMTVLPNCSDMARFDPASYDREALRAQFEADGRFVLLYVGAINIANDIPFLTECMERLKDSASMVWWFVGEGNRFEYLKSEIERRGIKNVILWGKKLKSEVPQYVNAADLGVVSFIDTPTYFENSPNKFFDYCAGGLPAMFTRTTWLQPHLEKYASGFICEENKVAEFCEKVRNLASEPEICKEAGRNARFMAEQEFSRDEIGARYLELLKVVASASN